MISNNEALPRVDVVDYDPHWPTLYQREQQSLRLTAGTLFKDIEHIGSTAVPGLPAKPIIDMMASCECLDEPRFIVALDPLDYRLIKTGMLRRLLFRKSAQLSGQLFHLHIVEIDTWLERKERIMRDHLIDPAFFEEMSTLLNEVIKERKTKAINYE